MRRKFFAAMMAGALMPAAVHAQATPSTSAGSTTTAAPAPASSTTPAPSNGNGTTPTAPARDTGAPGGAASTGTPAPLPFRGSSVFFDHSTSLETLAPGLVQSYQPSYQWWMSFRPRWALSRDFTVSARQDVTVEWTNHSDTTHTREPQLGDLWTDLSYRGIPSVWGIRTTVGIRAQWPLSMASRARGTIVTTGAIVSFGKAFENVGGPGGGLSLGLAFVGSHPFTSTNAGGNLVNRSEPCSVARPVPGDDIGTNVDTCNYQDASMNTAFSLATMVTAGYQTPLPQLSFSAMFLLSTAWLNQTSTAYLGDQMAGTNYEVPRAADDNRMRQSTWIMLAADYEVQKWLSLSVGYYSFRSVLDPNGRYGNPFYQPGGGSRVFLTFTFPIDAIYHAVTGNDHQHGPARPGGGSSRGVTMNERQPNRRWSPNDAARELRQQQAASGLFL